MFKVKRVRKGSKKLLVATMFSLGLALASLPEIEVCADTLLFTETGDDAKYDDIGSNNLEETKTEDEGTQTKEDTKSKKEQNNNKTQKTLDLENVDPKKLDPNMPTDPKWKESDEVARKSKPTPPPQIVIKTGNEEEINKRNAMEILGISIFAIATAISSYIYYREEKKEEKKKGLVK